MDVPNFVRRLTTQGIPLSNDRRRVQLPLPEALLLLTFGLLGARLATFHGVPSGYRDAALLHDGIVECLHLKHFSLCNLHDACYWYAQRSRRRMSALFLDLAFGADL